MNLTQDQIQYIDNYLKHHHVDYWDVRIELLDHIVSKVEDLTEQGKTFDQAMEEVHVGFGNRNYRNWNSGKEYGIFTDGSGYAQFSDAKCRQVNRKYRRLYLNEIKKTLTSTKGLLLTLFIAILSYLSYYIYDIKWLKMAVLIASSLPLIIAAYYSISFWIKTKKVKHLNMQYAFFYTFFSFIFLNFYIQLNPNGTFHIANKQIYTVFLNVFFVFNFVAVYSGYKVFRDTYQHFDSLHQKYSL